MSRIISTGSMTQSLPTVADIYDKNNGASLEEAYWSSLRILLLDYINGPRFKTRYVSPDNKINSRPVSGTNVRVSSNSSATTVSTNPLDEHAMIIYILPKLAKRLRAITIGEVKISNPLLRRSLLKFYNDNIMDKEMYLELKKLNRFEVLLINFTKASNMELTKATIGDRQAELYEQLSYFIRMILSLGKGNITDDIKLKLTQYQKSMDPGVSKEESHLPIYKNISNHTTNQAMVSKKPSFVLKEIPHIFVLKDIFNVTESKLQADVIASSIHISNEEYCKELRAYRDSVDTSDSSTLIKEDFDNVLDYNVWKKFELKEVDELLSIYGDKRHTELSKMNIWIPENSMSIFVKLISLLLQLEAAENSNITSYSQRLVFFISKFSKYWRLNFPTTLLSLLYTSANLTILSDKELNITTAESFFNFMFTVVPGSNDYLDTQYWNDQDRARWALNMSQTSNQCMVHLDNLLSGIFGNTMPKLNPVLLFYYSYVLEDTAFMSFEEQYESERKKWLKQLRKTLFDSSIEYYVSLLDSIPKDKTIDIIHIQDVAQLIIERIERLQKRFTKPLLDTILIAPECASFLIEAFGTDFSTMIKRVTKYNKPDSATALDAYKVFREIRYIYLQVQPNKKFPCKLENVFFEYLLQLCDDVSSKIVKVITNSIKSENWEPINDTVTYSQSVLDIFKMFNESISVFRKLEWENEYQISKIITFILKTFSDGLNAYIVQVLEIIESDLQNEDENEELGSEGIKEKNIKYSSKIPNSWNFHDIKNVLLSENVVEIPQPYEYRKRTCTLLCNLEAMIEKLNAMDDYIQAEHISQIIAENEKKGKSVKDNIGSKNIASLDNLYTIRIISADDVKGLSHDGLSNLSLSILNQKSEKYIGKTKTVKKSINPIWDEEFEFTSSQSDSVPLSLILWHHTNRKIEKLNKMQICGKISFVLDKRKIKENGYPNSFLLPFDTQGYLVFEVSLEREKLDAMFSMGKIYRSLIRARNRAIDLFVSKCFTFIQFAFSRDTLKTICGNNGKQQSPKNAIYDAIVPLFDYLNSNLNILGTELNEELLFKVMLNAWNLILRAVDNLILPPLSIGKSESVLNSRKNTSWTEVVASSFNYGTIIPGYGRALTTLELESIFIWLRALCVDFFYNAGEGPPLEKLKNEIYQGLLLVPIFYDKDIISLKEDAQRMVPEYTKYMQIINGVSTNEDTPSEINKNRVSSLNKRLGTLARKKTIMANATLRKRKQMKKELSEIKQEPIKNVEQTLIIVLRILISKGELEYVHEILMEQEKAKKRIEASRLIHQAIEG
ncbi:hypothetical protein TBLA_0D00890 [Henningerozyma blattae CBS 6284]|uniref:C2 domain-containing protein n=1 Tax=Henningerozyma blattae (strain ATCC 34711 / CBS 6284 / DSM 70876 / NBRC 10599 / NRRL Y-10934 / UCD 77-7) TaxID=1071380 RepID=I2H2J5_HENB6|nr:hypothetical protein TBLA_0D00890 [Tetrapisispora blattae CBS 6284]CCH60597.1 hypothetical protein TBLA_0D00890 [Tetrapisispora blattae CBS 6284]